jgi:hypothetical protein
MGGFHRGSSFRFENDRQIDERTFRTEEWHQDLLGFAFNDRARILPDRGALHHPFVIGSTHSCYLGGSDVETDGPHQI